MKRCQSFKIWLFSSCHLEIRASAFATKLAWAMHWSIARLLYLKRSAWSLIKFKAFRNDFLLFPIKSDRRIDINYKYDHQSQQFQRIDNRDGCSQAPELMQRNVGNHCRQSFKACCLRCFGGSEVGRALSYGTEHTLLFTQSLCCAKRIWSRRRTFAGWQLISVPLFFCTRECYGPPWDNSCLRNRLTTLLLSSTFADSHTPPRGLCSLLPCRVRKLLYVPQSGFAWLDLSVGLCNCSR